MWLWGWGVSRGGQGTAKRGYWAVLCGLLVGEFEGCLRDGAGWLVLVRCGVVMGSAVIEGWLRDDAMRCGYGIGVDGAAEGWLRGG